MIFMKWIGTALQLAGCILLASNIAASPYAYPVMAAGSILWTIAAVRMRETSLALLNLGFTAINLLGIWRWLL
jgi:hypothetical protein